MTYVVYTRTGNTYSGPRASCESWAKSYAHYVKSYAVVVKQDGGVDDVVAHWVSYEGKVLNLVTEAQS